MRTDIALADQIVQVGHACLEAGRRFVQPAAPCNLVVLGVPSVVHLRDAIARAEFAGIRCAIFHEPDDGMGDTAACTEPISGNARRVFRRFPLWGKTATHAWARGPPDYHVSTTRSPRVVGCEITRNSMSASESLRI